MEPIWWDRVVEEVQAYQVANTDNLPGAVFGAETLKSGTLVHSVGRHWSDHTICGIGSMSKAFIGTAVLLALEEKDMLDVNMPVCRVPHMDMGAGDHVKAQTRVRHLLQHTAGLPPLQPIKETDHHQRKRHLTNTSSSIDLGPTVPWVGAPGATNELILVDGSWRPARQLSLAQISEFIMSSYPVTSPPGYEYSYSTANYVVAARLVEALTGKSVNVFLRDKLFLPLKMFDSFFVAQPTGDPSVDSWLDEGVTAEQRNRIADVTLLTPGGQMPCEVAPGPKGVWDKFRAGWRFVYPDAGMYSTVSDLLTFLRVLRDEGILGSKRVLSRDVWRLLVENQGFGHTMGFGYRARTTPYGQSSGTLEHMGSFMTYFWYDPEPANPLLGVFLSQRLTNIAVNSNMADGMKVIFRVFVPFVKSGAFGFQPPNLQSTSKPTLVN